jgi:hypothetical protein
MTKEVEVDRRSGASGEGMSQGYTERAREDDNREIAEGGGHGIRLGGKAMWTCGVARRSQDET